MIRSNLSILLAERNLKITKVSNDTGISRTTLTALASNTSQGIQFETLNLLCTYLGISPEKLIMFFPVDINISVTEIIGIDKNDPKAGYTLELEFSIKESGKMTKDYMSGLINITMSTDNKEAEEGEIIIEFPDPTLYKSESYPSVIRAFQRLPVAFLYDIQTNIIDIVSQKFQECIKMPLREVSISFENAFAYGIVF